MHYKVLQLLANGNLYTSTQIKKQLAINQLKLNNAIQTLIDCGVQFKFKTAQEGYQLTESIELLDKNNILSLISKKLNSRVTLEIHSILNSTNQYALQPDKIVTPFVCLAEYQTAGRGRQGKQWISPYASGLCISLKYRYNKLELLTGLNIALAVTIIKVLNDLKINNLGIKWPNDILWQQQKLAGLLLESHHQQNNYEIVYGIGINVKIINLKKQINQPWVDLYTIKQKLISRNELAANLIEQCVKTLTNYPQVGLMAYQADWHRFDLTYNKAVTLTMPSNKEGKRYIEGISQGINEQGALLLKVGNKRQAYINGEISLRL